MHERNKLKALYTAKESIEQNIDDLTKEYLNALGDKRSIYITDHAIARYLERYVGLTFIATDDLGKLQEAKDLGFNIEMVRKGMLTLSEDRTIITKQLKFYRRGNLGFVIRNLAVVTVTEL